jgi:hypothetical protein
MLKTREDQPSEPEQLGEIDASDDPLESEIRRFLSKVAHAGPEMRSRLHLIAREEVELEELSKEAAELDGRIARSRQDIERLRADLARGHETYQHAGKTYSAEEIKADLEQRERRLQAEESTRRAVAQTLQVRQEGLEELKDTMALLEAVSAARRRLAAFVQAGTALSEKSRFEQWLSEAQRLEAAVRQHEAPAGKNADER